MPESGGAATLSVYLSGWVIAPQNIVVTLFVISGTATNGVDHTLVPVTVTILSGTNGTGFTIHAIQDTVYESGKTTQIIISSVTGGNTTIGTINFGQVTIADDDTLNIYIYDPTNCSGHIRWGIFDPTNTLIVRVRIYSGTTLIQQYVPPLTITGAFFINPNYSNSGGSGYIAPGTYQVIYDWETTGGVEIVSGTYSSFLGQSCPMSNGWWYNQTPTSVPSSVPTTTNNSNDGNNHGNPNINPLKRVIKWLSTPHKGNQSSIDQVDEIIVDIAVLPETGVDLAKKATNKVMRVLHNMLWWEEEFIQPFVLPKTGAEEVLSSEF